VEVQLEVINLLVVLQVLIRFFQLLLQLEVVELQAVAVELV
tara:strand:- start:450 stop:572 length:123 start_codon:yes stop_codon:yes gene_type:complete